MVRKVFEILFFGFGLGGLIGVFLAVMADYILPVGIIGPGTNVSCVILGSLLGLLIYFGHRYGGCLLIGFCCGLFGLSMMTVVVGGSLRYSTEGLIPQLVIAFSVIALPFFGGVYFLSITRREEEWASKNYPETWQDFSADHRLDLKLSGFLIPAQSPYSIDNLKTARAKGIYLGDQLLLKTVLRENLITRLLGDFQGNGGLMTIVPPILKLSLCRHLAPYLDDPTTPIPLNTILFMQAYTQMSLSRDEPAQIAGSQQSTLLSDKRFREDINDRFVSTPPFAGRFYAFKRGQRIVYEEKGIIDQNSQLQRLPDTLKNLMMAYPLVVALGGEMVPELETMIIQYRSLAHVALQLLADIGQETTDRLSNPANRLLCRACLVYCHSHQAVLPWGAMTYYGCRSCRQSRHFLDMTNRQVMALLDHASRDEIHETDEYIQINWFTRHQWFDFDAVVIQNATDEDVERFAIEVGNDTDPIRSANYKQITCRISPSCHLSENSLRVLRHIFGKAVVDRQ